MSKFKVLNEKDLEVLKLSDSELKEVDKNLFDLINVPKDKDGPRCKDCDCSGFVQGNPSTYCRDCGHSWNRHR